MSARYFYLSKALEYSLFSLTLYVLYLLSRMPLAGDAINDVLDAALCCLLELTTSLPLESDLVACTAQFLTALSGSRNSARLAFVVGSVHVNHLAQYATALSVSPSAAAGGGGAPVGGQGPQCRLNGAGLAAVMEAMGQLFVRSKHEAYFSQVSSDWQHVCCFALLCFAFCCTKHTANHDCNIVRLTLQLCAAVFALLDGKLELHNRNVFQRFLSALSGLARSVVE